MSEDKKKVLSPDGHAIEITFTPGLPPPSSGPNLFVLDDGSLHIGELLWVENHLAPGKKSRVLRTTNPFGGLHEVFDVPAHRIEGYAFAGERWPRPYPKHSQLLLSTTGVTSALGQAASSMSLRSTFASGATAVVILVALSFAGYAAVKSYLQASAGVQAPARTKVFELAAVGSKT